MFSVFHFCSQWIAIPPLVVADDVRATEKSKGAEEH